MSEPRFDKMQQAMSVMIDELRNLNSEEKLRVLLCLATLFGLRSDLLNRLAASRG